MHFCGLYSPSTGKYLLKWQKCDTNSTHQIIKFDNIIWLPNPHRKSIRDNFSHHRLALALASGGEPPDETRFLTEMRNCLAGEGSDELLRLLDALIQRCFDRISRLGYRSVALIHIPAAVNSRVNDAASADALIEAIRSWDGKYSGRIDDIFLVDRKNDFSMQLIG
jgi:hypothetical protein